MLAKQTIAVYVLQKQHELSIGLNKIQPKHLTHRRTVDRPFWTSGANIGAPSTTLSNMVGSSTQSGWPAIPLWYADFISLFLVWKKGLRRVIEFLIALHTRLLTGYGPWASLISCQPPNWFRLYRSVDKTGRQQTLRTCLLVKEPLHFFSAMSLTVKNDPMRLWTMSHEELLDEMERSETGYLDSSSTWRQFEQFFASHCYELCFNEATAAKRPLVDLIRSSYNPFMIKPSIDGPFVHHDPSVFTGYRKRLTVQA